MSRDFDDELVERLRAADDIAGWTPDVDAALQRIALAAPELTADAATAPPDGRIEVRIGDLAVVHTPDERRWRGRSYAVIVAAAAAIALIVAVVPRLVQSTHNSDDRLAVSPLQPGTSAKPVTSTQPTAPAPPTAKTSVPPHGNKTAPAVAVPAGPPPAPLSVTMSLSATTVQAGNSITVNYSWTDGNGHLLYLNAVGVSAMKVVRPPACSGAAPAPKPGSGHGSWTFTLPLSAPYLIDGLSLPFDHPERIKVGVQIDTGAQCGPVEEKTVTQWVTLYPAVAATPAATSVVTASTP